MLKPLSRAFLKPLSAKLQYIDSDDLEKFGKCLKSMTASEATFMYYNLDFYALPKEAQLEIENVQERIRLQVKKDFFEAYEAAVVEGKLPVVIKDAFEKFLQDTSSGASLNIDITGIKKLLNSGDNDGSKE